MSYSNERVSRRHSGIAQPQRHSATEHSTEMHSAEMHSATPADRWDGADLSAFTGTYGDYLMSKVAKVFPELGDRFDRLDRARGCVVQVPHAC